MAETPYAIEMLNITKKFPGIIANDNITLQLKKGEIHALLGENGAGKSTLMSVLFGLYQPEEGIIKKDGKEVKINDPNDANDLGIGMVHQHFKLVECFTVLDNIILGVEPTKNGFLQKKEAREKVLALSEKYGLQVDPDAYIEDITVGMQQRTEILKMLYRDNEILIFDEPTAVLTPQEIEEDTISASEQALLGGMYVNGHGVEQDEAKGVEILTAAAEADDPDALYALGTCYCFGNGVERDMAKAVEYLTAAAGWSEPHALFALGTLYLSGQGVEQDQAKGRELLEQAAALGDEDAVQLLEHIGEEQTGEVHRK